MNTKTVSKTDVKKTDKPDLFNTPITDTDCEELIDFPNVLKIYAAKHKILDKSIGVVFERYMTDVFKTLGYETEWNGKPNDKGVDIVLKKMGGCKMENGLGMEFDSRKMKIYAVQCKYRSKGVVPLNDMTVFKDRTARKYDNLFFITTTRFSTDAKRKAGKTVELFDGNRLYKDLILKARKKGFMY